MHTYLKQESYYNDLYDLGTIESCLSSIERWQKLLKEKLHDEGFKNLWEEARVKGFSYFSNIELWTIKGERFRQKDSIIKEWMDRDRRRDEKLRNTQEPKNIHCPNCSEQMKATLKDLYDFSDEPLRVLFFFECDKCGKRKGVFDDGEYFKSKPESCPKCNQALKNSYKQEGKTETWTKNCPSCGFAEAEVEDLEKNKLERSDKEKRDQELLNKQREEFCLASKEGEDYLEGLRNLKAISDLLEKVKERQTDPDYQVVGKLKRLSIVQLEKALSETLEKEKYAKLSFDKPSIDRYVVVPFTIQDADSLRKENDSERNLRKIMKKILEGTNWRLMSEGVSYRLGYLSGRLKGYEQEEDLLQVVKNDGN